MPAWSGLGISLGYQPVDGSESFTGSVSGDLVYLKNIGINKVRIVTNVFNTSFRDFGRTAQSLCKSAGMYVIGGCSANEISGGVLTSSNFSDYQTAVIAEAVIAEAAGIDEFVIGNEEELRIDETTIVDVPTLYTSYIKPLATAVQAVFSGTVSYNICQGYEQFIVGIAPGDIDKLGINVYGTLSGTVCTRSSFQQTITDLKANATWGSRMYISEWNTNLNADYWGAEALKPDIMTSEVANRLKIIKDAGVSSAYFFTWVWSGSPFEFAVIGANRLPRKFWNVLSTNNGRRWFI